MDGGSEPQLLAQFRPDPTDSVECSKIVDFADRRGTLKPTTLQECAHGPMGARAHGPWALGPWAHEPPPTFFSRNESPSEISGRNYRQIACICVPRLFTFDDFSKFLAPGRSYQLLPTMSIYKESVHSTHIFAHIYSCCATSATSLNYGREAWPGLNHGREGWAWHGLEAWA